MTRDEQRILKSIREISDYISMATFDHSVWKDVAFKIRALMPGSFVAIQNVNMQSQHFNVGVACGIDPSFLKSYEDYYIGINPWFPAWAKTPSGRVLVASETSPANQFSNSEFYNDWILPQNGVEGAVGMKIDLDNGDAVQIPIHFPIEMSDAYNRVAAEVLRRLRGNIKRAIQHVGVFEEKASSLASQSALLERTHAMAFIVDIEMNILDHNDMASRSLSNDAPAYSRMGRLKITDRNAMRWLTEYAYYTRIGKRAEHSSFIVKTECGCFKMCVSSLPVSMDVFGLLSQRKPLILVTIEDLSAPIIGGSLDRLGRTYGLSPSELAMLRHLGDGKSVNEACEILQITKGTGRQRLKGIFAKTGTHRQSELMLLIYRMR